MAHTHKYTNKHTRPGKYVCVCVLQTNKQGDPARQDARTGTSVSTCVCVCVCVCECVFVSVQPK